MKKYKRLTLEDREEIAKGIYADESFVMIASRIHRTPSTVTREIQKGLVRKRSYFAVNAQKLANKLAKSHGRKKKLDTYPMLKKLVYQYLKQEWSPEEIAKRLKKKYPLDMTMHISHEAIYQYLYCLPRGELKKELMKGLRQERKLRQPRKYSHHKNRRIKDIVSISERPAEVVDRVVPGHWEGDLIVGKDHTSALGTLVERTTRLTLLVPMKARDALSVSEAFAKAFARIPVQMKKTLTYDRGTEMAQHKLFTKETKIQVYFADPYSPWQRGTNENTNGLIRQYFPKGTDFKTIPLSAIRRAEQRLNTRPRKVLDFYTPSEAFESLITGKEIALAG